MDTGVDGKLHLSLKQAQYKSGKRRFCEEVPVEGGPSTFKPYPLSLPFGWHSLPFCRKKGGNVDQEIGKLGTGWVLYFKLLKYLGSIFVLLTLLSTPAMFFLVNGSAISADVATGLVALSYPTLASLGEVEVMCDKQTDLDLTSPTSKSFSLSCPTGTIAKVEVFLGAPSGDAWQFVVVVVVVSLDA